MNNDILTVKQNLGIVGNSLPLQQAVSAALQAAPYDVNVLIVGENGVGKEVFHKILHNYGPRKHNKCIPVNCGALPEGTINSELFGHVKGAFTGAIADRKGYFEEANGGTIFLDEVGELPLDTQARLLRVIETGEYQRMGSNEIHKTNVRVVAATNRDLHEAIEKGKFRQDLYYRLAAVTIRVPALRERPEDIHLLFRKFAADVAAKYNCPKISVDDGGRQFLMAYSWPGNVRQLLHLVEEISIVETERVITSEILKKYLPDFESRVTSAGGTHKDSYENGFGPGEKAMLYKVLFEMKQQLEEVRAQLGLSDTTVQTTRPVRQLQQARPVTVDEFEEQEAEEVTTVPSVSYTPASDSPVSTTPSGSASALTPNNIPRTLEQMEKEAIENALKRNDGNKRKAAEELGISERTIHRKIADYGL
jgi:transcriptional regulator with PAS, ATPase and Fis domain